MTVFDASAVLAWLQEERGSHVVEQALTSGGSISAASWSEIAQKIGRRGVWRAAREVLLSYGIVVEPVTQEDAESAAALWERAPQLSLADRLCLALGDRLDTATLTADTAWSPLPRVVLIR